MFDISWGELAVLGAFGVAVTGKRDLPKVCHFVGHQLGRVVGLLQGARARADRFAHHNELKALQNELRSGLRELDQVKTELAVAASTKGVMGRTLGPMTRSANYSYNANDSTKTDHLSRPTKPTVSEEKTNATTTSPLSLSDFDFHVDDGKDSAMGTAATNLDGSFSSQPQVLSPQAQSERAVMEEEWNKQGIGFRAQAEQGSWSSSEEEAGEGSLDTTRATGSELLEHLERQCLIFDQYDRVVGEQEAELEQRVDRIQKQREQTRAKTLDETHNKSG